MTQQSTDKTEVVIIILVLAIISLFMIIMWSFYWRGPAQEVINRGCRPATFDRFGYPFIFECPSK
jgi:hypothetical protein